MTDTLRGPSSHLFWSELACHDGTPYPSEFRGDRAVMLAATFEHVRELLGNLPIVILSGYRTKEYNATLEGAASKSQHIEGRALDLWHPTMTPRGVYVTILREARHGTLPLLGGIGLYPTFVHIDVRPRIPKGHIATWGGRGVSLPEVN